MFLNHPLLVSAAGEETPLKPATAATWSQCSGALSTPYEFTITPSTDLSGVQDGDLVIFWFVNSVQSSTTQPMLDVVSPSKRFWRLQDTIFGGNPNDGGRCSLATIYKTGDTAYTFKLNFFTSSSNEVCWRAAAFRGCSQRCPLDYITRPRFGSFETTGVSGPENRVGAWRSKQHGNIAKWIQSILYSASAYHFPFGDSNIITQGTRELDLLEYVHPNAGNNRVQAQILRRVKTAPLNEASGTVVNSAQASTLNGWSFNAYTTASTTASGSRTVSTIGAIRDNDYQQRYLSRTETLVAGETYWFRLKLGGVAVSASSPVHGIQIINPSASSVGMQVSNGGETVSDWGGLWTLPDDYFVVADGASGVPDQTTMDVAIRYTATESGTHTIRVWVLQGNAAPDTTTLWSGTGTSSTSITVLGYAFAQTYLPDYVDGTGELTGPLADTVPEAVSYFPPTAAVGTLYYDDGMVAAQIVSEDVTTFNEPALQTPVPWGPRSNLGDTGVTSGNYPYRFYPADAPFWYLWYEADRVLYPFYYNAESGGSITDGKYYWEVTIGGTTTDSTFSLGIYPVSWPGEFWGSYGFHPREECYGIAANGTSMNGDQAGSTWAGGFSDGDVFGFALDVQNDTLEVYENGTLIVTLTLGADFGTNHSRHAFWRFAAGCGGSLSTTGITFDVNFTGPFTYTKPTGYVAYDWINEVT